MFNKISISILGCGWLGIPLAKSFINDGVRVKGSTTSPEKLSALESAGIEPFLVHFKDTEDPANLTELLKCDIFIIAVPPGRNDQKHQNYEAMLSSLTNAVPESSIKKIIFISSTAVYGDVNKTFVEGDDPETNSETGQRMIRSEQAMLSLAPRNVVLRLAGLFDEVRHPGRFLAGKKNIPNGLAPLNLVHRLDVVAVIKAMAYNNLTGVFNVCAPHHPARQEFYSRAARKLDLEPPHFIEEKAHWKLITSERLEKELGFTFQISNLYDWLEGTEAV